MNDILKLQEIALANVLNPDQPYFYRSVCRWYSEKFHTPLHQVFDLPMEFVFLNYFESITENQEEEELEVRCRKAIDPTYEESEEESIQDLIDMIQEEEKTGKKPPKAKPKESLKNKGRKKPEVPSSQDTPVVRHYQDEDPPLDDTDDPES